jgi:hypothetical protein
MFGLFKPKEPSVKVNDKVWMSVRGKEEYCKQLLLTNNSCLFVAWFEGTVNQFQITLNLSVSSSNLILAENLTKSISSNRKLVFVEHYPLRKAEQHLFLQLNLPEANVLCSLDEPLFQLFDGPKLIDVMKKMGMTENEEIEHSMVSRSIQSAQESIAEKIATNRKATSQKEWFELNKATQSNAYKK